MVNIDCKSRKIKEAVIEKKENLKKLEGNRKSKINGELKGNRAEDP